MFYSGKMSYSFILFCMHLFLAVFSMFYEHVVNLGILSLVLWAAGDLR